MRNGEILQLTSVLKTKKLIDKNLHPLLVYKSYKITKKEKKFQKLEKTNLFQR